MLELIFQGFIEWTYGLILECWEYFSSLLLNVMSMDFAYLKERMPVIQPVMQTMLALGWALLIGNLAFQAVRSIMTGLGFEAEDPKLLFGRTFVFSFLLVASPQICQIGLDITARVIDLLGGVDATDAELVGEAKLYIRDTKVPDDGFKTLLDGIAQKIADDEVVVLGNVSGAAGSIGSELVNQIQTYEPQVTILLDIAESPLHDLMLELQKQ